MPNLKPLISAYLSSLHTIHDSGKATDERSYYPALAALFGGVGATLSPRVVALHDVADRGIGHPDFLLQVEMSGDVRAAVEVEGTAPELDTIITSEQVRRLFEEITKPSQLERLDIRKPLEWAEANLNRTSWEEFSKTFNQHDAVNYFYEPFLEAFDPQLRREIVRYMVARVDTVLREELGVEDGLADPNVFVLDPCCGTGAYLLEVLRHIGMTLQEKGEGALLAAELKKAASQRVFGFEILPAPFIVAQLQVGSLLTQFGAPPSG